MEFFIKKEHQDLFMEILSEIHRDYMGEVNIRDVTFTISPKKLKISLKDEQIKDVSEYDLDKLRRIELL